MENTTISNLLEIVRSDDNDYIEIGLNTFGLDGYDGLEIIFYLTYAVVILDAVVIGRLDYIDYPATDDFFDGIGNVIG